MKMTSAGSYSSGTFLGSMYTVRPSPAQRYPDCQNQVNCSSMALTSSEKPTRVRAHPHEPASLGRMEDAHAEQAVEPVRPGLRQSLTLLARNRSFTRLYSAQLVSYMGDWFATVALVGMINDLTGSATLVTLVLVTQMLAIATCSPLGGHLADRFDRQRLMVTADVVRVFLAAGFLLVDDPGDVWLAYVLIAGIGALTAVFEPTSTAALPN